MVLAAMRRRCASGLREPGGARSTYMRLAPVDISSCDFDSDCRARRWSGTPPRQAQPSRGRPGDRARPRRSTSPGARQSHRRRDRRDHRQADVAELSGRAGAGAAAARPSAARIASRNARPSAHRAARRRRRPGPSPTTSCRCSAQRAADRARSALPVGRSARLILFHRSSTVSANCTMRSCRCIDGARDVGGMPRITSKARLRLRSTTGLRPAAAARDPGRIERSRPRPASPGSATKHVGELGDAREPRLGVGDALDRHAGERGRQRERRRRRRACTSPPAARALVISGTGAVSPRAQADDPRARAGEVAAGLRHDRGALGVARALVGGKDGERGRVGLQLSAAALRPPRMPRTRRGRAGWPRCGPTS